MNIEISITIDKDVIDWIEGCRSELLKCEPEFQFYGPGFEQVVEKYEQAVYGKVRDFK